MGHGEVGRRKQSQVGSRCPLSGCRSEGHGEKVGPARFLGEIGEHVSMTAGRIGCMPLFSAKRKKKRGPEVRGKGPQRSTFFSFFCFLRLFLLFAGNFHVRLHSIHLAAQQAPGEVVEAVVRVSAGVSKDVSGEWIGGGSLAKLANTYQRRPDVLRGLGSY